MVGWSQSAGRPRRARRRNAAGPAGSAARCARPPRQQLVQVGRPTYAPSSVAARFRGAGAVTPRSKRPDARSNRRIAPAPVSATHRTPGLADSAWIRPRGSGGGTRVTTWPRRDRPAAATPARSHPDRVAVGDHRQRTFRYRDAGGDLEAAAVHPQQHPGRAWAVLERAAGHPDGVAEGGDPGRPVEHLAQPDSSIHLVGGRVDAPQQLRPLLRDPGRVLGHRHTPQVRRRGADRDPGHDPVGRGVDPVEAGLGDHPQAAASRASCRGFPAIGIRAPPATPARPSPPRRGSAVAVGPHAERHHGGHGGGHEGSSASGKKGRGQTRRGPGPVRCGCGRTGWCAAPGGGPGARRWPGTRPPP